MPAGDEFSLVPHEREGSEFVDFSGDCDGPTCSLEMTGPMTVTATFEPTAEAGTGVTEPGTTTEAGTTTEPTPEEKEEAESEFE